MLLLVMLVAATSDARHNADNVSHLVASFRGEDIYGCWLFVRLVAL